jgi:hypothetical protein
MFQGTANDRNAPGEQQTIELAYLLHIENPPWNFANSRLLSGIKGDIVRSLIAPGQMRNTVTPAVSALSGKCKRYMEVLSCFGTVSYRYV